MSPEKAFALQIQAFHTAVMDDCKRALQSNQSDAMAVQLRENAAALTNLQLAMLAATHAVIAPLMPASSPGVARDLSPGVAQELLPGVAPEPSPEIAAELWPVVVTEPAAEQPRAEPQDRVLSGDALSRFVSRKLGPDESPHDVWQDLHEAQPAKRHAQPAKRGRNPAVTKSGFRSKPG